MAMPVLPLLAPSRSTRLSVRQPVKVIRYGGGHAVYLRHGIAGSDERWAVHWAGLTQDQALQLQQFFEDRKGIESFLWTPPYGDDAQKFLCPEWAATPLQGGFQNLDAVLIRRHFHV